MEINGIAVDSELGDQPFNKEILQGAKNRVKNLKREERKMQRIFCRQKNVENTQVVKSN